METLFNPNEGPLTREELAAAIAAARKMAWVRTRRALFASIAFFLSCASVIPFLEGHSLHAYWQSVGRYLVLLSMGLLIPFVICLGMAMNWWFYLRSLEKIEL